MKVGLVPGGAEWLSHRNAFRLHSNSLWTAEPVSLDSQLRQCLFQCPAVPIRPRNPDGAVRHPPESPLKETVVPDSMCPRCTR